MANAYALLDESELDISEQTPEGARAPAAKKPAPDAPAPRIQTEDEAQAAIAAQIADLPAEYRRDLIASEAKALARQEGGAAIARMIDGAGLSLGEIEKRSGFRKSWLSRLVNAHSASGPALWSVFAIADVLGYEVRLSLQKKGE